MSILKYFTSNKTSTGKEDDAIFTSLESSGVSSKEYENIEETIKPAEKAKKKKKKLHTRRRAKRKLQNMPTSMA